MEQSQLQHQQYDYADGQQYAQQQPDGAKSDKNGSGGSSKDKDGDKDKDGQHKFSRSKGVRVQWLLANGMVQAEMKSPNAGLPAVPGGQAALFGSKQASLRTVPAASLNRCKTWICMLTAVSASQLQARLRLLKGSPATEGAASPAKEGGCLCSQAGFYRSRDRCCRAPQVRLSSASWCLLPYLTMSPHRSCSRLAHIPICVASQPASHHRAPARDRGDARKPAARLTGAFVWQQCPLLPSAKWQCWWRSRRVRCRRQDALPRGQRAPVCRRGRQRPCGYCHLGHKRPRPNIDCSVALLLWRALGRLQPNP